MIEVTNICVRAEMGAELSDCIKSALRLACDEWRDVTLLHNGCSYEIKLDAICRQIQSPMTTEQAAALRDLADYVGK